MYDISSWGWYLSLLGKPVIDYQPGQLIISSKDRKPYSLLEPVIDYQASETFSETEKDASPVLFKACPDLETSYILSQTSFWNLREYICYASTF